MPEPEDALSRAPPSRPTIALPPRSSMDSLFRGGTLEVSPGPMTLVSSFFAEDPDAEVECRSFSQLLAGAMSSPIEFPARVGAGSRMEHSRPPGLSVGQQVPPVFTLPPGISPTSLLDSPTFFPSMMVQFGISHQQTLAQVAGRPVQSNSNLHLQSEYPPCLPTSSEPTTSTINMVPIHTMPSVISNASNASFEHAESSYSEQRSQQPALVIDKPADDGYNWRKYGQKQVKGSEFPRSYYKCTHPSCPVKKKVERSMDGQITEIIYKGQHNHQRPAANKRSKEGGGLAGGPNDLNENLENFSRSNDVTGSTTSKRDREHGASEQLSGSSDGEEVDDTELKTNEGDDTEPHAKRMNTDNRITELTATHRTVTEPRIIVQTTSEVDLLDDGYRWRKYGQKVVKGNPHPRSYYKCTHTGCNVRKHVERASSDPKAVKTTYEGKHNHDVPAARNSSHNTGNVGSAANVVQPKPQKMMPNGQLFHDRPHFRGNNSRPLSFLQMKEEHEIT